MLISLSKNSWHSKLYKWVGGKDAAKEFKSLCPYFWTIVFYVAASPAIALFKGVVKMASLVSSLCKKFKSNKPKKTSKTKTWLSEDKLGKVSLWFGRIYLFIMCSVLLYLVGFLLYKTYMKSGLMAILIGLVVVVVSVGAILLIMYGIMKISEFSFWTIVKGMIYSVKHKVCPMIKWDENVNETTFDNSPEEEVSVPIKKKRKKKDEI